MKYLGFQNFKRFCHNMMILFTLQCVCIHSIWHTRYSNKSFFLNWKEIMVDDSHSYPSRIEGIESVRNWAQKGVTETWEGSGLNLGLYFSHVMRRLWKVVGALFQELKYGQADALWVLIFFLIVATYYCNSSHHTSLPPQEVGKRKIAEGE